MSQLLLHPRTQAAIDAFLKRPAHAILVNGPPGIGKGAVAELLACALLAVSAQELARQPYLRRIGGQQTAISIEAVRDLSQFLSRQVPGSSKRVIILEEAESLTTEAQNALLKTLEEPPAGTHIILTAADEQALLPTIRSRVTQAVIIRPDTEQLRRYFEPQYQNPAKVEQAMLLSGGLPGLMSALLENQEHPLRTAVATARQVLQASAFERLALVDTLAKDKVQTLQLLNVLQHMAHLALLQGKPSKSWQRVLTSAYEAAEALQGSAQPKLVVTNLMLSL